MKCIICANDMSYYFTKHFNEYDLGNVEYVKCPCCGFSASTTHFEMTEQQWETLNHNFHTDSFGREDNPYNRNQRYFNQALLLHLLLRSGIIASGEWLDWGSGPGAISMQLKGNFGVKLNNFDAFTKPSLFALTEQQLIKRGYTVVTNTAVFEHVRDRRTLDQIESYVAPYGCLAIHTLVRGEIPADPDWMYLLPVHCAFHTNRSMATLMQQWGYRCSLYNEHAKMWVLFRAEAEKVAPGVDALNRLMGWKYLHFKSGFTDFWP